MALTRRILQERYKNAEAERRKEEQYKKAKEAFLQEKANEQKAEEKPTSNQIEVGNGKDNKTEQNTVNGSLMNRLINPLSTAAKADSLLFTLSNEPVIRSKKKEETGYAIAEKPVDLSLEAMETANKEEAGKAIQNKLNETVLPGVTRPYTMQEQLQKKRRDGLKAEKDDLQNRISSLEQTKATLGKQVKELGNEQSASLNKTNREGDSVEQRGEEIVEKRKKIDDITNQIDTAYGRIREIDDILNTPKEITVPAAVYLPSRLALGAMGTVENWASGLAYTIGDALTGGGFSDNQKKINDYLSQNPQLLEKLHVQTPGVAQKIANDAGVSVADVDMYRKTSVTEYPLQVFNSASNLSDGVKYLGNAAEEIGAMLPYILLTAGYTPTNPAQPMEGIGKFIASKVNSNVGTGLIASSVYGQQLETLARERGFDARNYLNAAAQGAIEGMVEKYLGFSDYDSFLKLFTSTGSTGQSILKSFAKYLATGSAEGLEEVINVPLSEIVDRMTGVSENTNVFGNGGVFDLLEMLKSGLNGATVGLIMGGAGGLVAVAESVAESGDIRRGLNELDVLQGFLPESYKIKIPDAKKVTMEDFNNLSAKFLENVKKYKDDIASGKVEQNIETDLNTDSSLEEEQDNIEEATETSAESTEAFAETESNVSEENLDAETKEEVTEDADSVIAEALREAETDVYTAGNELLDAFDGNVRDAVNALYAEGKRLSTVGTEDGKRSIARIEAVRNNILQNNATRIESHTKELNSFMHRYGISNVVVDMDLAEKADGGYYNPSDRTIHISPKLSTKEAVVKVALHELTHHAAAADSSFVKDAIQIKDKLVSLGVFHADRFDQNKYTEAYVNDAKAYAKTDHGKAELKSYISKGYSKQEAVGMMLDEYIKQEMAADLIAEIAINNQNALKKIKAEDKGLWQRIIDGIRDLVERITGKQNITKAEQKLLDTLRGVLEDVSGETVERTVLKGGYAYNSDGEAVSYNDGNGSVPFSRRSREVDAERITTSSTDAERTKILSKKTIKAPVYTGQAEQSIADNRENLESAKIGLVKAALGKIGEEFGIFGNYIIDDIDVEVSFSKGNLKESVSKKSDAGQLARLIPMFRDSVENSVGIEAHDNRYYYDNTTVMFENLLGGYMDGDVFVPVRFGLKHSDTGNAVLYVVVCQERIHGKKITDEIVKTTQPQKAEAQISPSTVTYSITDIVPFVKNKDLLRYFPDDMLTNEQKKAKWEAIAETIQHTNNKNDVKYAEFVRSGNKMAAENMVKMAAKANGYTVEAYHGTNGGDFTVFDWDRTQSTDGGFFGRGYYFSKSKDVATEYGDRVIESFLNLGKTFVWSKQVNSYKGKKPPEILSRNVVSRINMARLFPEIFKDKTMTYFSYDSQKGENVEKTIKWGDLERLINAESGKLTLRNYADGTFRWHAEGKFFEVPVGEVYKTANDAEDGKFFAAINALKEKYDGLFDSMSFDDQTSYTQTYGDEITKILKNNGFNSAMDTPEGGEIVVFDANRIKSADTIVYDDDGNVVPISKRFDSANNDIRFSRDVLSATERENIRLKEQREYFKRQMTKSGIFGNATAIKPNSVKKIASDIASDLPGVTSDRVRESIRGVYDILERAKKSGETSDSRYDEAFVAALGVAKDLVDSSVKKRRNPLYDNYMELKNKLKNTAVKFEGDTSVFGGEEGFSVWKKQLGSSMKLSSNADAVSVEKLYGELCKQYPDQFSPDVTEPSAMFKRMGEVAMELKKITAWEKVNPIADIAETLSEDIATRIIEDYFVNSELTFAEEQNKKVQKLKAQQNQDIKTLKTQHSETVKKLKDENARLHKTTASVTGKLFKLVDEQSRKIEKMQHRAASKDVRMALAGEEKRMMILLRKLNEELLQPDKKKHVPDKLRTTVAGVLKEFEGMAISATKTIDGNALDVILNSIADNGIKIEDEGEVQDLFRENLKINMDILHDFAEAVDDKQKEILEKQKNAGSTPLTASDFADAMSHEQKELMELRLSYTQKAIEILKMVSDYVNKQNQIFIDGKKQATDVFVDFLISDLTTKKRYNTADPGTDFFGESKYLVRDFGEKLLYESVNADLFFAMIGDSGNAIAKRFRSAQDLQEKIEVAYGDHVRKVTKGKYSTFKSSGYGGNRITVSIDGNDIDVSKAQLMSLYLLWKRPAGRKHLEAQGACFATQKGEERIDRTFRITEDVMRSLKKKLSDEDIRVANSIGEFLSGYLGEEGNKATMEMYGYSMFGEKDYFPIETTHNAKLKDSVPWGAELGDFSLENAGFTKRVDPRATSAIMVRDVFDVADKHVKRMAMYCGYAPVCNDVQHILRRPGVREAIIKGMGQSGMKYLENFLLRVNQNKISPKDKSATYSGMEYLAKMAKKTAVMYNLSTVAKQPLSIIRACSEIEMKYMIASNTMPFRRQNADTEYSRAYHRMIENSGVAKLKMMGHSDTGFGTDIRELYDDNYLKQGGIRNVLASSAVTRGILKANDKFSDFGMLAAAKADEATFVHIWKACELKVEDKYSTLSDSEKMKKVTEMFNSIVGKTQVVDSLLDNPPFKDRTGNAFGVFMNEPVKTFGNLCVAVSDVRDRRNGAKKKLVNVITGIAVSNLILEPMISAIFSGLRDEEDDSDQAFRKFLKNFVGVDITDSGDGTSALNVMSSQVVDGFFGTIPAIGEIYSFIMDAAQGYSYEHLGVEVLSNLVEATKALLDPEQKTKTKEKVFSDWMSAVCATVGIPYSRFKKGLGSTIRNVMYATDNHLAAWNYNKLFYRLDNGSARSGKYFYDIMAHAYKEGDIEAYYVMRKELAEIPTASSFGVDKTTITNAIEKRGGDIEVGSQLWYVDLQAGFHLDSFNKNMAVEKMLTSVYEKTGDKSVLQNAILNSFSVNKNEVNITDPVELEKFFREIGEFSYMILANMAGDSNFQKLSAEQKQSAIKEAYDYAKCRSKKNLYNEYNMGSKVFEELYGKNASASTVAKKIISKSK